MSTAFLLAFSEAIIATLLDEREIEIVSGRERAVIRYLATELHAQGASQSLISFIARLLLACPDVEELYADNDRLKALVEQVRT